MKSTSKKINWLVISILVVVVVAISTPMYYYRIMNATNSDYGAHIVYTYSFLEGKPWPELNQVHPLLQVILAGMVWISRSRIDPFAGMIFLLVACQVVTAGILYFWFGKINHKGGDWIRALAVVTLTVISPILALLPLDHHYYYGYIGLANYHNPTMLLLRPLALISFYFAYQIFAKPRHPLWVTVVSGLVVILSALAKPNYLLCILPAILFLGIIWTLRKLGWDWRLYLFGFALPGAIVLFVQWLLLYGSSSATSIIFNPLVERYYSNYLFWKFLLSILFPLVATILLFRKMVKDPYVWLGWIGFAAGAGMLYLFSETGNSMYAVNFRWGAQIMLFLLIAAIVRFFLRSFAEEKTAMWKRLVIWGIYLLYTASGVLYYIHCITNSSYS